MTTSLKIVGFRVCFLNIVFDIFYLWLLNNIWHISGNKTPPLKAFNTGDVGFAWSELNGSGLLIEPLL